MQVFSTTVTITCNPLIVLNPGLTIVWLRFLNFLTTVLPKSFSQRTFVCQTHHRLKKTATRPCKAWGLRSERCSCLALYFYNRKIHSKLLLSPLQYFLIFGLRETFCTTILYLFNAPFTTFMQDKTWNHFSIQGRWHFVSRILIDFCGVRNI